MKIDTFMHGLHCMEKLTDKKVISLMKKTTVSHKRAFDWYQVKTATRYIPLNVGDVTFFLSDPCSNGNLKISHDCMVSKLYPVVTCPNCQSCKYDCYAMKGLRNTETFIFLLLYTYMAQHDPKKYADLMIKQIERYQPKYVRLHESGDFFSLAYTREIERVCKTFPNVLFYAYTKTAFRVHADNFNLVDSFVKWRGQVLVNFGDEEMINQISKDTGYPICPCDTGEHPQACMRTCTLCAHCPHVLFYKH